VVTSKATNTIDALALAVEQEMAEQLDENTREFIAGLENQFNVKFTEEEVAEVMVAAKPEDNEDEEGDEEDGEESDDEEGDEEDGEEDDEEDGEEDGEESDDEEGEDEYHDEGSPSGEDYE
jgi:hypothetical protein